MDGRARCVTALGESDSPKGWREKKANGGVLIDLENGKALCRGLSMPHSPRWYADRLWVLESGNGTLATIDRNTGRLETIAQVAGFTRGLDLLGPFAFIGLWQVRASALFIGIPHTERLHERTCGVWVVDIRNGRVVAFLRFDATVQEIIAVKVLPGIRYPEILEPGDELIASS